MENTVTENCPFCEVEFTVSTEDEDLEVNFCPFCGDELYEEDEDEDDYDDEEDDESGE